MLVLSYYETNWGIFLSEATPTSDNQKWILSVYTTRLQAAFTSAMDILTAWNELSASRDLTSQLELHKTNLQ